LYVIQSLPSNEEIFRWGYTRDCVTGRKGVNSSKTPGIRRYKRIIVLETTVDLSQISQNTRLLVSNKGLHPRFVF